MQSEIGYFNGNVTKCSVGKQLGIFQALSPESRQEQDTQLTSLLRHKKKPQNPRELCPHVREPEVLSTDILPSALYDIVQIEGKRKEAGKAFGEPQMDNPPRTGKQVENPCFGVYKDTPMLSPHGALCWPQWDLFGSSHCSNTGIPTAQSSLQYRQNPNAEQSQNKRCIFQHKLGRKCQCPLERVLKC